MADFNYHGEVVVYDLDDTLFRERDFCRSGFRFLETEIRKLVGECPEGLASKMNDRLIRRENPFEVFESLCRPLIEETRIEWDLQKFISLYRSHYPDIQPIPEVMNQLIEQSERGIVTGIITDGRSITQRNKIKALGLDRYVAPQNILISEETGFDKTHPEPFIQFVRNYPEARKFTYIGDNPKKDFHHPRLLGWDTVCVPPHPDNVHHYE